jgi:outer membrane biosynthesis protein TonB
VGWTRLLLATATAGVAVALVAGLIVYAVLLRQSDRDEDFGARADAGGVATDASESGDERPVASAPLPRSPSRPVEESPPAPRPAPPSPKEEQQPPADNRPESKPETPKEIQQPPAEKPPVSKPKPPRENAPKDESPRPAPAAEQPAKQAIKRIQKLDDEELRKELLLVPELALDAVPGSSQGLTLAAARLQTNGWPYPGPALASAQRPDLVGLPLRMGLDCRLGKEPAENLQVLSRKLRTRLEAAIPRGSLDPRPDPEVLRRELTGKDSSEWLRPEAIPALLQLLQAEGGPVRLILVELLAKIDHKRATEALAIRAVVDLSAAVREAAIQALSRRPREEYRELLLAGLRYPWMPVQQHASEALVALRDTDAAPQLAMLLGETPGTLPFTVTQNKKQTTVVRELVRVNHLANCLLCHAPSFDRTDLVRGAVPTPGQPLPAPVTTPQYYDRGGSFARADITYLRQDFSVVQTVENPGKWPSNQRYDYLVRLRQLTPHEIKLVEKAKQDLPLTRLREPVLFALRELTGKDVGSDPGKWQTLLRTGEGARSQDSSLERAAPGDWGQFLTVRGAPESDAAQRREAARIATELAAAPAAKQGEGITQLRDGKGVVFTQALATAIPLLEPEPRVKAREALVERMGRMTSATLGNKLEDEDPEVRRAAALAVAMKEDKTHAYKLIELLGDDEAMVARAAHTALKSLSGEDFGPAKDAAPEEQKKARLAWAVWWATQQQEKK